MIRLALDWTPNTNHTGFFIAQEKGFYSNEELEVSISDPSNDNYQVTPAKKLETGLADVALAPTESVISYRFKSNPFMVKAIAAVLQKDASAVTVLKERDIISPAQLDGKSYASYKARYEDEIIKQMIRNDGGDGDLSISYPDKLGIWNTLINGEADATWIFLPWEGVEARSKGIDLRNFVLSDFDIPYGYSPVLLVSENELLDRRDEFKRFLEASRRGFEFAIDYPDEAASILAKHVPAGQLEGDALIESQKMINEYYTSENEWGRMKEGRWYSFISWLKERELIPEEVESQDLFENLI
ncbi:ABC transporter substrate-binding protein [Balneola sp. MJW-20]|uniref:ABC transporter substrate-binding protein n=1 Tax=Gracilimonas aurantiaca TaxID=3234185 RepID=UPI0034673959